MWNMRPLQGCPQKTHDPGLQRLPKPTNVVVLLTGFPSAGPKQNTAPCTGKWVGLKQHREQIQHVTHTLTHMHNDTHPIHTHMHKDTHHIHTRKHEDTHNTNTHTHTQTHTHTLEPDRYRIFKADTDTNIL